MKIQYFELSFKFPVFIDGQLGNAVMPSKKTTVETVILLSRKAD